MPYAIRFHQTGGPEVLRWEEVAVGDPAIGEARVRHEAVGLNFLDTYHRSGLYPLPLPSGLGQEGAGVVEAVGSAVIDIKVGDRVAYAGGPVGAYSQVRCLPADRLLKLPVSLSFRTGAAMLLQGLTAAYLLRRTYRVQRGDAVLIHAAAGGVGLIACQWAKALGATVIGTVSTEAKADLARAHGCDHIIFYTREDVAKRVRELTGGQGVAVVYDGVGNDTFAGSLNSLRARGMLVIFGNASGPVPPFDPLLLSQKGSLFMTRPTLVHYTAQRDELVALGTELFEVVTSGKVRIEVNQTYPLADAAKAHRDLEARQTMGSTVLLPVLTDTGTEYCHTSLTNREIFRILVDTMATALKKYSTFVLLVVYCIGLAVPMVHHHAEDATGSGLPTIVQHSDADHCKHIPILAHDDCALCTVHNGRATAAVSFIPNNFTLVGTVEFLEQFPYITPLHFLSSQTRRGPPSLYV